MIVHVVEPGETIRSIAERYNVPVSRIVLDNAIDSNSELVPGQALVILYPEQTYLVSNGDSLESIAISNDISIIQLLRNNPFLSDRQYIYPGETLVIRYGNDKGTITTNGYCNVFIRQDILRKTLPYLTYLTIFGHRVNENAEIEEVNDTEILQIIKNYQVAPIMAVSTLTLQGESSYENAFRILNSEELVDRFIDNILIHLWNKGYYGVNLSYLFLTSQNLMVYEAFTEKLVSRLHPEGYRVFITLSENMIYHEDGISFERVNYRKIGQLADSIIIMNYNWGYSYGPPAPVTSLTNIKDFLDYVVQSIPSNKIIIGIPLIGYDWPLPYMIGITKANSIRLDNVLILAKEVSAEIEFDESSQTPYFTYTDSSTGVPIDHIVWFVDARSVNALLDMTSEYQLNGTGIWNIMNFFPPLWLVINSQYNIVTLPNH